GFSYTSDFEPAALDSLVDEALLNGRYNHADDANVLPEPRPFEVLTGLASPAVAGDDPQRKIDSALEMERRATSLDARVRRRGEALYSDGSGQVAVDNGRRLEGSLR